MPQISAHKNALGSAVGKIDGLLPVETRFDGLARTFFLMDNLNMLNFPGGMFSRLNIVAHDVKKETAHKATV